MAHKKAATNTTITLIIVIILAVVILIILVASSSYRFRLFGNKSSGVQDKAERESCWNSGGECSNIPCAEIGMDYIGGENKKYWSDCGVAYCCK